MIRSFDLCTWIFVLRPFGLSYTNYKAQSTKHKAQSTKHKAQSTKYEALLWHP